MRVAFLGTPEIGASVLCKLLEQDIKIEAVITKPDKKAGRGRKEIESACKYQARTRNIKTFQPKTKDELTAIIKKLKPDLCIVAAYGVIIPDKALNVPKYGMINFHPSLLPKYRGPAPITDAILNGDKETGVSIIKISSEMDAGDILDQKRITLKGTEEYSELADKLTEIGSKMIARLIPKIINNQVESIPQNKKNATFTKIVRKEDGKIDWQNMTPEQIERMSRAYKPWPGVYSFWKNKKVDFSDIEIIDINKDSNLFDKKIIKEIKPGLIKVINNKVLIGTKNGIVAPNKIKIEGKKALPTKDFICGYQDFKDTMLN